ncbi:MAG: hypothetical protein K0R03_2421 [Moraxellaceae bacterium]|jgi:hypothetical protein|nr:hypothetical protein [Moraxellaceae bacterium]
MAHVVLLGDSIFDNGAYTAGGPDVVTQLRGELPGGWQATLAAVDGAITTDVPQQLKRLPADASHLVASMGGNDALGYAGVLNTRVSSSAEALFLLAEAVSSFEADYRKALAACLKPRLPLTLCTIYNGNFNDRDYQRLVNVALATFNDVIIRAAVEHRLAVLELRLICTERRDYANPIEPSSAGGAKIARAIGQAVRTPENVERGASVAAL